MIAADIIKAQVTTLQAATEKSNAQNDTVQAQLELTSCGLAQGRLEQITSDRLQVLRDSLAESQAVNADSEAQVILLDAC